MTSGTGGGPSIEGQHGHVVDYLTLMPLAGFTVSDGANSTTTDADGNWVLPLAVGAESAPVVTGPDYSVLQLARIKAAGSDVDVGLIPIPSVMNYGLELQILGADSAKALVQVVITPTGACKSVTGGTLTVASPAGAAVAYFASSGFPTATQMSDVTPGRPSAVIFNIDPTATALDVTLTHPTCKLSAAGTASKGAIFEGIGPLAPAEPGDNNATLVLLAE